MAARMAAGVISWKTIRMHRDPGREHLGEVPGDRLAFAVLVGREVDLARVADEAAELGDLLALLPRDDVKRLEVVVDVDAEARPRLGLEGRRDVGGRSRQVADVADRRLDDVVTAEIARDGLGLRGGLDDD